MGGAQAMCWKMSCGKSLVNGEVYISIYNTLTCHFRHISWYKDTQSVTLCEVVLQLVKAKFSNLCLILSHEPPLYTESKITTAH